MRSLPAGPRLGLLVQRRPLPGVEVPAARDVRRAGDPLVLLQLPGDPAGGPGAPGRVSGSVLVAPEPVPVEAVRPSGGHEEQGPRENHGSERRGGHGPGPRAGGEAGLEPKENLNDLMDRTELTRCKTLLPPETLGTVALPAAGGPRARCCPLLSGRGI